MTCRKMAIAGWSMLKVMDIDLQWIWRLAVALAIGLLVGIERGWKGREAGEGEREIGLRTMALIGLLGGVSGLLGEQFDGLLIGLVFIGLSILLAGVYRIRSRQRDDIGLTTEIAALATFLLSVLAGLGHLAIASAGGVATALLLGYKGRIHGWLRALNRTELTAVFKLLVISVVLLPLLPDRGYGPGDALNPYVIWWMVVLIAAISFAGYFAVRIAGARAGTVFTALFGGLASSTATTLNLARLARREGADRRLLAGAVLLACATMFPRMTLVASLIHPPLFVDLAIPTAAMMVLLLGPAVWLLRAPGQQLDAADLLPSNPLELRSALLFGGLLAIVMLLGQALTEWFGDAGVFALAAASGVADVDAITLSLSRMADADLAAGTAVLGIVTAAAVNSIFKAALAASIGGAELGKRVSAVMVPAVAVGLALALWGA